MLSRDVETKTPVCWLQHKCLANVFPSPFASTLLRQSQNKRKKDKTPQASVEAFLPNEGSHLKFCHFQQPFLILRNKILSWCVASEWTQIQRGGDSLEVKDVLMKKKKKMNYEFKSGKIAHSSGLRFVCCQRPGLCPTEWSVLLKHKQTCIAVNILSCPLAGNLIVSQCAQLHIKISDDLPLSLINKLENWQFKGHKFYTFAQVHISQQKKQ